MKIFTSNYDKNSNIRYFEIITLSILLYLITSIAFANGAKNFEPADNIRNTAKKHLEEMSNAADNTAIEISVSNIDPRLKLRKCKNKLLAFTEENVNKRGRLSIAVTCDLPVAWKVLLSASVDEFADVIIAKNTIARKSIITTQDIETKRVKISSLRKQPIFSMSEVLESTSKRQQRAGSIIFEDSICLVCRGDSVQISAKSEFLNINLEGIALADAGIGETTLVRNKQSKRSFSAKVIGKDHLEVKLADVKNNKLN